ncbi:MAG: ABC-2 type transport system permease protein [Rhodothermales bacterium]|jgi:ABC-2 type transport system permease protein
MLKGFWKLTWVEIKIFVREPMGVIGTLAIPVVLFVVLGKVFQGDALMGVTMPDEFVPPFNIAVFASVFIAVGAVLSLVAIMSIYREGGILKRLRATPLSPLTILGSHVAVKLLFTALGLAALVLAGKRLLPGLLDVPLLSFSVAVLFSTLSILSVGFVIASLVPTARFAQPVGSAIIYPMVAISGLFFPLAALSDGMQFFANLLPMTHAVGLVNGVWAGGDWLLLWPHVLGLVAVFVVFSALSAKVFRWE